MTMPGIPHLLRPIIIDGKTKDLVTRLNRLPLDPALVAEQRVIVQARVKTTRTRREELRSPQLRARLKLLAGQRRAVAVRLQKRRAARPLRSPDQVIVQFVAALRGTAGGRRFPAALLIRTADANQVTFERRLAKALKVNYGDLSALGITVHRVTSHERGSASYTARFDMDRPNGDAALANLAWALRRQRIFHSVALTGLRGQLFAPTPTEVTQANPTFAWHLALTRVTAAHQLTPPTPQGRRQGDGILIAHPDTGWANHEQYNAAQIDSTRPANVITGRTGRDQAKHSVSRTDADRPEITHGTGTGSVILGGSPQDGKERVSSEPSHRLAFDVWPDTGRRKYMLESTSPIDPVGHLSGVAPQATMIPIKFISDHATEEIPQRGVQGRGVIRIFDDDLVAAIDHAITVGAHVISLSVGGLMHDEVRDAMDRAVRDHDVVVVAAAGQTYTYDAAGLGLFADSVILPAAYPNVIAVAGCTGGGVPWRESLRGPNVDATAPADGIWVADFVDTGTRRSMAPVLRCASGTSFASAFTAGAAALWLAHWGREELITKYRVPGREPVPLAWVFRHQLQRTSNAAFASSWDTKNFGPGLINVQALLATPLPSPEVVQPPPQMIGNPLQSFSDWVGPAAQLFEDSYLELLHFVGDGAEAAQRLGAAIVVAGQQAINEGLRILEEGWTLAAAAAVQLSGDLQQAAQKAMSGIDDAIDQVIDAGEEFVEETVEAAEVGLNTLEKAAGEVVDTVGEAAEDLFGFLFPP